MQIPTVRRSVTTPLISLIALGLGSCTITQPAALASSTAIESLPATGCEALPDIDRSSMVIFEPSTRRRLSCNPARAAARFVPASTYKIPHTLIAIETGAIPDENAKFTWDHRDRGIPAWNRNLSMAEAVPASAVWVFQEIAQRIGQPAEANWVGKFDYGNANVGLASDLRHFWLSGPLQISALEQVAFLQRLHDGKLPVSADSVSRTIAILRVAEASDGSPVYGKSGAMLPIDDQGFLRTGQPGLLPAASERTGWFVGWVERSTGNGGPVYFALNLDLDLPDAMAARTGAAYAILKANGFAVPDAAKAK